MGEICDFESEWGLFLPEAPKHRRAKGSKEVRLTLTKKQYEEYRAMGGAAWIKKLLKQPPTE